MRFWFVHSDEVSLREQIVTQVSLGILCGELAPGERLPSVRELARRFKIHPNTVSAGYRELHGQEWVEFRHGSGVYVRAERPAVDSGRTASAFEQLLANFTASARALGVSRTEMRVRLREWLAGKEPRQVLVIEPEPELRIILMHELGQALGVPVAGCGVDGLTFCEGTMPVALPSKAASVRRLLPEGAELVVLQVRSITTSLAEWLPAANTALVAVASRWPAFNDFARTMLVAAGFEPDALLPRDAREADWCAGLDQVSAVVCDSYTATLLPTGIRAIPFRLIAGASLDELRERVHANQERPQ